MKNIFIFLVIITCFIGCKKKDFFEDQSVINLENIEDMKKILLGKVWKISSYSEPNSNSKIEEKSRLYNGVALMFASDNSIMAHKGDAIINGLWKINKTVVYIDQPSSVSAYSFTINFGDIAPFNRISNQWIVKRLTKKEIILGHSNPSENKQMILVVE